MPKQKINQKEIIKESLKVFRKKGYHYTSMADIAQACGLFKGSLYHYFSSKEVLMKEVLGYMHHFFTHEVFAYAYDAKLGGREKLLKLIEVSKQQFLVSENGCIFGNLALETAGTNAEFLKLVRLFFEEWMRAIAHIFSEYCSAQEAQQIARDNIAEVEGAVMMIRIFNDPSFLHRAHEKTLALFDAKVAAIAAAAQVEKAGKL